ncbi:2-octaprenyl-6-methoxyphenyl hydroxylase [Pontibacterium granulatum]|uniref:2-octaprenyl-6-methoxyphenyl hydroxylase n=1 Tax=Pontibacterium granulatum TaxID=2036029 RepID=UPI00249AE7DC|nr:2-octaprenyl-6-methoxyphenyl hydroxylase [Pontibacterium granulatum]MDI3325138.1 2-octaprenyl-6-methoxyphenyl hydroxylase [Pontibacterium granulatum]
MKQHYDVVIVGGGMVGASLACALLPASEKLDLNIAVIEAFPLPEANDLVYQPSYDSRATALAYGARTIYELMGIWDTLREHLSPIEHIHVSDRGRFGATRLHAQDEHVAALGYVVENHWLGRVLLDRLQQSDAGRVDFICPAEVTDIVPGAEQMALSVKLDEQVYDLTAELVVMADGGRSELRERMGIGYTQEAYGQHAVIANISPDRPHEGIAYERFTDSGPMALLPLEDEGGRHRCGLVWTVPDEMADEILGLDDAEFIERVHERFGYRAGCFVHVGERHAYPLKLSIADEQVRAGLAVLGNAAHALHPIAGQGYNLALRGVVALADQIIAARKQGIPVGDLGVLQAFYEQQRYDQQRTIGLSDRVMKLFSNNNPLFAFGRDLGLQLLDVCPPAKTVFARGAMGLDIPAPDLK